MTNKQIPVAGDLFGFCISMITNLNELKLKPKVYMSRNQRIKEHLFLVNLEGELRCFNVG